MPPENDLIPGVAQYAMFCHRRLVISRVAPLERYPCVVVDVGNRYVGAMFFSEQSPQEVDLDETVVTVIGEVQDGGALVLNWLCPVAREVVERTFL